MNSDIPENILPKHSSLSVALLVAAVSGGAAGGAERFYSGLHAGLSALGLSVALISLPADEPSFDAILHNYRFCGDLDLPSFDVVISTKAPTYGVTHPCHVMYLVHTVRAFDDMFQQNFPTPSQDVCRQRALLHRLDAEAMGSLVARFAIGNEVARRLYRWRGLDAEVLHPPLGVQGFAPGPQGDYFFLPGRLHPWKRVDLVIEAFKGSSLPMRLVIAGTGEDEERLRHFAAGDSRIEFTGRVDDATLLDLYSHCLAVPFVPIREDYGYITLEAFASHKPVITCTDSGEPTHFVQHRKNGLICSPDPKELQQAFEELFTQRDTALEMGNRGAASISGMSWRDVAFRLVDAALRGSRNPRRGCRIAAEKATRLAVLDMQPIDPPVGGGRLRLLGLYHNLGKKFKTTYVGTYDWPGESYRKHFLSESLEEIDIPLSEEHHEAARLLRARVGDKTVIDITFGKLGHLSPEYVAEARRAVCEADMVSFSHPWVYPLVEEEISSNQYVVYDSHNVEGHLRAQLLNTDNPLERDLLRYVVEVEQALALRADLIFTCSQEDSVRFNRLYGIPFRKMRIVPNGVMAFSEAVLQGSDKAAARKRLQISQDATVALFIGSPYPPNVEAAAFIAEKLAPALPETLFVIAGGVGSCISSSRENVRITGQIDEDTKHDWLSAADMAVNPMFSGSGTNIKMFDFMAFGLPTVTTPTGARGIDTGGRLAFLEVSPETESFVQVIRSLESSDLRTLMEQEARLCVEEGYAWERISPFAGEMLSSRKPIFGQPAPLFSVVIPVLDCHDQLDLLMESLRNQIERDFEVVIIDQSVSPWKNADHIFGMPVTYMQTPVKGAVRARNTGAAMSQGNLLCFIDTKYPFEDDWLLNMRTLFQDHAVCAAEGEVVGEELSEIFWSPLSEEDASQAKALSVFLIMRSHFFQSMGGFSLWSDLYCRNDQMFCPLKRLGRGGAGQNIGWISTWNTKCGIAAYSKYLVSGMLQDVAVFANHSEERISEDNERVKRCWYMDCFDFQELENAINEEDCKILVLQFHYGFFNFSKCSAFIEGQIQKGRKIFVMMHCTTDPVGVPDKHLWIIAPALQKCEKIFVHSEADLERLKLHGLTRNAMLFPHGILDYSPKPRKTEKNSNSHVRIASYGYFREHKGLLELIHAVKHLKQNGNDVMLRMVNAEYPAPDSRRAIENARAIITTLELEDSVELITDYLEDEDSMRYIQNSDLIVYPYQDTTESASGALRQGMASGCPVAVTPLEIFDDVASCVFKLPGTTPEQIASGIQSIVQDIREESFSAVRTLQEAASWSKKHRFSVVSKKLHLLLKNSIVFD